MLESATPPSWQLLCNQVDPSTTPNTAALVKKKSEIVGGKFNWTDGRVVAQMREKKL
jgi:hypothetical protein